jgi:hypothetical protein
MARTVGLIPFSGNFEPKSAEPFDGRDRVENLSDLTGTSTWQNADGNVYLYSGIKVTVYGDSVVRDRGVYVLLDPNNINVPDYTNIDNWVKIGESSFSAEIKTTVGEGIEYTIANDDLNYIGVLDTTTTINLPLEPEDYVEYTVTDLRGDAETNSITISGNGKTINGETSVKIDSNYGSFTFKYSGSFWYITSLYF